jgi:hypothetical protein
MSAEGVEALEKVAAVGAEGGTGDGTPAKPIVIESARPVE